MKYYYYYPKAKDKTIQVITGFLGPIKGYWLKQAFAGAAGERLRKEIFNRNFYRVLVHYIKKAHFTQVIRLIQQGGTLFDTNENVVVILKKEGDELVIYLYPGW